jgi:hypothetical protein
MRPSKWKVYFDEHNSVYVPITAWNRTEAKILAQAQRIQCGLTYRVYDITEVK